MGQIFDKTLKQEAVRLMQTSGKSQKQVAEDLGGAMSTLSQRSHGHGNARESEHSWEAETSSRKTKNCAVYAGKMIFYARNAIS